MSLARFRVDPWRVRVGVRRRGRMWEATVSSAGLSVTCTHKYPRRALVRALLKADADDFPGVDLHMQWAYEHPWVMRAREPAEAEWSSR